MTYEFVRRIGRGGMGVVDLAHGPDGEEVALKRLSLHGTPEELEKLAARIDNFFWLFKSSVENKDTLP